jgi:hypothetical protein
MVKEERDLQRIQITVHRGLRDAGIAGEFGLIQYPARPQGGKLHHAAEIAQENHPGEVPEIPPEVGGDMTAPPLEDRLPGEATWRPALTR